MQPAPGFPPEIQLAFEQLCKDMTSVAWKITLYKDAYLNPENRAILFERTETVFSLFEDALVNDLILALARLMDPPESAKKPGTRPNLTLLYLFDLISTHGNAPSLHSAINARYAKLASLLADVKTLRDKVLAHRDRTAALTTPLALSLTPDDLVAICDEFKGIINDVYGHFADTAILFDMQLSYSNLESLIRHLRRGIQATKEDFERELQQFSQPVSQQTGYGEVH